MSLVRRCCLAAVTVVALTGCLSGEPKVAVADKVPADQAAALTATESASEAGTDESVLQFVAVDIAWDDAPETVPADTALTVVLENQGSAVHNLLIEELGDDVVAEANGGATARADLEPLAAGSYTYYCNIPGHRAAGMEGVLTAE